MSQFVKISLEITLISSDRASVNVDETAGFLQTSIQMFENWPRGTDCHLI
jgi:hypothetical protein